MERERTVRMEKQRAFPACTAHIKCAYELFSAYAAPQRSIQKRCIGKQLIDAAVAERQHERFFSAAKAELPPECCRCNQPHQKNSIKTECIKTEASVAADRNNAHAYI